MSNMTHDIAYSMTVTKVERWWDFDPSQDTPYLIFKEFHENLPCDNGTTSYHWKALDFAIYCPAIHAILNTLRPRQDGRHFPDDIFKRIFLNENVWILTKISLKFVPMGPIYNIPALVLIISWRRLGDKLLSEPMMVLSTNAYMRHSASMS